MPIVTGAGMTQLLLPSLTRPQTALQQLPLAGDVTNTQGQHCRAPQHHVLHGRLLPSSQMLQQLQRVWPKLQVPVSEALAGAG